jgi:ABC-2 type transport system ATP-binding protein
MIFTIKNTLIKTGGVVMSEYVLQTADLTKTYSRVNVVDKVNIEIKKGDIYGFIGKNGAGKTTTIRVIVGLAGQSSGEIELFGEKNLNIGRRKTGTVIEYPALYPYMTAEGNVECQRILLGVKDKNKTKIKEILDIVGLGNTGKKKAKNFSLGMKQRLAIALALIGDPEFLFLDEPTNGLDPTGIKEIRDLILKLNKERDITVMVSSHILGELAKIATRYGVISKGKLVKEFYADDLKDLVRNKIKIKVNDAKTAVSLIKNQLNIKNCELKDDTIYVYDHLDESGKISSLLAKHDIIIESISKDSDDCEEFFIKLMEGEDQDA